MEKYVQNEVEYYYDSHPTVEDLMGETSFHGDLVHYLMEVLRWLFHGQLCAIYENLNFYQTLNPKEYPVAPDIAVIKGLERRHLRSWTVGKTGPAPHVTFEIASKETWHNDLKEKPLKYALMGVEEYFLYDPEIPPHVKHMGRRLIGWRLNKARRVMEEMLPDQEGRLWSQRLESFLVPDGTYLRLYESNNQRRLTEAEAREQKARMLEEKLRSLGVNPDEL
jgi:Uma2 family endonuclease